MNAEALASLAERLLDQQDVPDTADQVVASALHTLEFDYGGVTLMQAGGRLETVGASDDLVIEVDRWQYQLHEGPCHQATWEQHALICEDLTTETRWPTWTPRVVDAGIKGLLSVEMGPGDSRLGALNLYSTHPRQFTDEHLTFAHLFARHAAVALANAQHTSNLSIAVDARTLIGQAQGLLMERYGLDSERAFGVLQRYSQDHNIRLRTLAQQIVDTRQLPPSGATL